MKRILKGSKREGFTLAEILLSLTIIGIVAAIALPSLLGNANERAWEAQKKALQTRMSQAIPLMPSLNGYGIVGEGESASISNSAEIFLRDGLSKAIKITNICNAASIDDCGFPTKVTTMKGDTFSFTNNDGAIPFGTFSALFSSYEDDTDPENVQTIDIYGNFDQGALLIKNPPAAFETVNGESILVYYNPFCAPNFDEDKKIKSQQKVCANFIYDLNGPKGPNTVGKDIGFMTAIYSTDSIVGAPIPYGFTGENTVAYSDASTKCKGTYSDSRLPSWEEAISIVVNAKIYNNSLLSGNANKSIWTNRKDIDGGGWVVKFSSGALFEKESGNAYAVCVKR